MTLSTMAVQRKFALYISPHSNWIEDMVRSNIHGVISPTAYGSLPMEPPYVDIFAGNCYNNIERRYFILTLNFLRKKR